MDRMLYTAMSGAKQTLDQQAVVTHNLANATTPGFRAQLQAMRSLDVAGEGLPTRSVVQATTPGADFSQGPVSMTGRSLDIAIDANGWLAVQAEDGSEGYTKRGDLQVDNTGMLRVAGRPVLGEGGPLVVPLGSAVSIGSDGTVSALGEGETPENVAQVGRLKLVSSAANGMLRGDDGLFRAPPNAQGNVQPLPADENVRVATGALEGSNVSATEAMVAMIANARRYELQMKGITSADENAQRANSLLSLS